MAPRFTTLMYQVYPSDHGTDALVCFPFAQSEFIFSFRDKLTEALLRVGDIKVNRVQGYPLPPDSTFRFYSESHAKLVEEFVSKKRPNFFSRLMNSPEWAAFQKEKRTVNELIAIEIETSHDFPCVVVHSRIHSEVSMSELIQEVSSDLKISLPRNKHLGAIKDVVISNQRFEL